MNAEITAREAQKLYPKISQPNQRAFLAAFARTAHLGQSCDAAGIDRHTQWYWRETEPEFKRAFEKAQALAAEYLEEVAVKRAAQGVSEPVFYKGEVVGHVQKYSDTLIQFLMRGVSPQKYGDRTKIDLSTPDGPIAVALAEVFPLEALEAARARLLDAKKNEAAEPESEPDPAA